MVSTTLVFTTLLAASAQAITLTLPKSTSLGQRIAINPDIVNTAKPASLGERMIKRAIHSEYLDPHNAARAARGAQALTWSDSLASKAQAWANGCKFQHSGAGENLAAGTGSFTPAAAIKLWTDEAPQYNPSNPVPSHWTQVVWKATTQVGCAVAACDGIFDPSYGKAQYYVCEYNPVGNVIGQFPQNV